MTIRGESRVLFSKYNRVQDGAAMTNEMMFGFIVKFLMMLHVREVSFSYRGLPAFNIIRKCSKYLFLRGIFRMLNK